MGATRFPNGVEIGDGSSAAAFTVGGTSINPVTASAASVKLGGIGGTVITGLGTASAASLGLTAATTAAASLSGTAAGWAGTAAGNPAHVKAHCASGNVVVQVFDNTGAQASNAGTVSIVATGT